MARPVNPSRIYEDYNPPSDIVSDQDCDTMLIYLPGFRKEQLRVQFTTSRVLKISGERQMGDNKWKRFNKEFRVPSDCETKDISAKFEGGILYIRQPKVIKSAATPTAPAATAAAAPAAEAVAAAPKASPAPPPQASELPQKQIPPPQMQTQPPPPPPPTPPQPPRLPQTEQQGPLTDPQKGSEGGKPEKKDPRKDGISNQVKPETFKEDQEGKGRCEVRLRPREMVGSGGFFTELSKPENCKRLAVSVLVVLGIGFYATYMFNSLMEDVKEL